MIERELRHLIEALINPYSLIFIGLVILLLYAPKHGQTRGFRLIFLAMVVALFLLSTGWLAKGLTHYLEGTYATVEKVDHNIRWIVVLGGGQAQYAMDKPNNTLSTASLRRLIEGMRLHRQLPKARLLLSGGGMGENSEAATMARLADEVFKLPKEAIVLEPRALNTAQQAVEIKPWVGGAPFYLVTSAIHMPRAMALCQQQGLHPIPAPTDFTYYWQDERWHKTVWPTAHNIIYMQMVCHELLGRLWSFFTSCFSR